eukprot:gnl/MRDRNA2_/MRDRNA2_61670_c0_seq2.p3 gnl/MRDRNA2_/MRDRNA2_61670_c0~~gnl/MRDRNA2_/MRDRNA2_61670_c0_seq2.p3  ORF type:complete len:143 (-),score=24.16 gnl/MRDRNA2_/MRDRNA2_61670_c0_seq2:244-672(-)
MKFKHHQGLYGNERLVEGIRPKAQQVRGVQFPEQIQADDLRCDFGSDGPFGGDGPDAGPFGDDGPDAGHTGGITWASLPGRLPDAIGPNHQPLSSMPILTRFDDMKLHPAPGFIPKMQLPPRTQQGFQMRAVRKFARNLRLK